MYMDALCMKSSGYKLMYNYIIDYKAVDFSSVCSNFTLISPPGDQFSDCMESLQKDLTLTPGSIT